MIFLKPIACVVLAKLSVASAHTFLREFGHHIPNYNTNRLVEVSVDVVVAVIIAFLVFVCSAILSN